MLIYVATKILQSEHSGGIHKSADLFLKRLAALQDMASQDMINTVEGNLGLNYDAYHTSCYPYECTYSVPKTLYVQAVEFLGALGGLIQIAVGLGSVLLWPAVLCCCHWESGDRAWDPRQERNPRLDIANQDVHVAVANPRPRGAFVFLN